MKLSERLARAATERAEAAAAGTTVEVWRRRHREAAANPHAERPTVRDAISVIVAAQSPVTAVDPDPAADPRSICPTCGRGGEIGMVDLHGRTADWSCEACGTMWRVALPAAPPPESLPPS